MTPRSFGSGLLFVAVLVLIAGTTADPDLWGHLRFGQDMLAAGTVKVADVYSFTSDVPWVNHEWVAELAMAIAYSLAGPAGLNLLRIAVVLAVLGIAWTTMAGLPARHRVLVASAGALGMLWRAYPIRPQLFSLLCFALLLKAIDTADRRRSARPLLLVPLVMLLWVNAHGGWLVGIGMLGLWAAMTAITASWRERLALAGIVAASLAATLVNPYGFEMWRFLSDTVRVERPVISDWQPLYRLPWSIWTPWIATLGILVLALKRGRGHRKTLVMAVVLGLMTLRVSRLDAFFAIAAMFFAARALADAPSSSPEAAVPARRSRALAWGFAAALAAAVVVAVPRLARVPIAPGTAPDSHVAEYMRAHHLEGRLLVWFDWGEYIIWHFGPDLKVSMDGRRETVYSPAVVDAHLRFYDGGPGAVQYAEDLRPDYVLIPAVLPVVEQLVSHGWRAACRGPTSVLLTRRDVIPCDARAGPRVRFFPDL